MFYSKSKSTVMYDVVSRGYICISSISRLETHEPDLDIQLHGIRLHDSRKVQKRKSILSIFVFNLLLNGPKDLFSWQDFLALYDQWPTYLCQSY